MNFRRLDAEDKAAFDRDGFLLIPSFFHREEIAKLLDVLRDDSLIDKNMYDRADATGLRTRLSLWYLLDDSVYSLMARCERMVSAAGLLLEGEPAHFHSKLMKKDPRVGGAWEWHQDYGYWYNDGFLYPDMISALTALSPANRENGCLQVIKGSHKLGRLTHGMAGEQAGADPERVEEALRRLELIYAEMQPGDTLFFHSNLLHRSDSNLSENPRLSLITAYNLITNKPFKGNNTSSFMPIARVPDASILESQTAGISEKVNFKHK